MEATITSPKPSTEPRWFHFEHFDQEIDLLPGMQDDRTDARTNDELDELLELRTLSL